MNSETDSSIHQIDYQRKKRRVTVPPPDQSNRSLAKDEGINTAMMDMLHNLSNKMDANSSKIDKIEQYGQKRTIDESPAKVSIDKMLSSVKRGAVRFSDETRKCVTKSTVGFETIMKRMYTEYTQIS